ncbi:GNAT family N-acetyltransferase [Roseovarius sp. 2305UL8-3]|uniref:GNAT family N-acetyltransferase n=1 Tax=Roseovarius conchicola TaxID=3121636 RepID=UPI003528FC20
MQDGLTTQRLVLRPVRPFDLDKVHAIASDYEVVHQTGTWPWPADRAFTAARCVENIPGAPISLAAWLGNDLVGLIGVRDDGDLGYMLACDHWGQGYATEMGQAVVQHAQAQKTWSQLKACVFEDNPGSVRVLEKLGFVEGAACIGRCAARDADLPIRTFTLALARP